MQLILGAGADSEMELFSPLIASSSNQFEAERKNEVKKVLEECTKEANCGVCDDKPVCDSIRRLTR